MTHRILRLTATIAAALAAIAVLSGCGGTGSGLTVPTVAPAKVYTLGGFQPREWVLANMTDAICSRKLYELIMREAGKAGRAG